MAASTVMPRSRTTSSNSVKVLSQTFLELADDIDEATLAFEEKASGNDEELAKLRQLKGLLKSLS